ncbi:MULTISPECIES: hypothetical protein [Dactylosporangium]|uniref:Uncharacterized protein n=2 Tax=Dactylosporangium TaxID=35753 RepID=A0A9W6NT58_9ACTN|nr:MULTISPECIES: hypothetical protein [Dactylosporangium]UAB95518.1 hypothetical protein Dvina_47170 [Dactylosporangium vinaceum]UWZ43842.1 hypothetical protein Dmats_41515 [Dactylosporangium matsuzakiense]GLL07842.1 hypothetical protein GCM10017581_096010 [Dactylosporangium matsuzakiense]
MSHVLPVPKAVKDLFDDLLGRPVTVNPADPMKAADVPRTTFALYTDERMQLMAVIAMDFELTAYAGAAIGLIPPGGAQACIEDKEISKMIGENAGEICNILAGLINKEDAPRVKLHQTFLPGESAPADAVNHALAIGRRLDLKVDVSGYGGGKISIALAG